MKKTLILSIFVMQVLLAFSKVELPAVISSNMVLQQNSRVNLWGKSKKNTSVTIVTSWNKAAYKVTSDNDGQWTIQILTPKAGGPYTITFNDGQKLTLTNIMLGEVWFCSGQSNMEMPLKGFMNQPIVNANNIIASADNDQLRLFTVKRQTSIVPLTDVSGSWAVSDPAAARQFSAVAFQYGQLLQKQLKVPVGIIVSSWGGTPIKAWIGQQGLDEFPEVKKDTSLKVITNNPSVLFNGMIAPLTKVNIRGFLWYQGESDRWRAALYEKLLPAMVQNWRAVWNQGELPFYYAQIAPWLYPEDKTGLLSVMIRESQLKASKVIPNSGMVVTLDVGSDLSIHPPDKTTVAQRFLYNALSKTYHVNGIAASGPEFNEMKINGREAVLSFNYADMGIAYTKSTSGVLEIAGADQVFYPAVIKKIEANRVTVESEKVDKPVAVRYGFRNYLVGSLYNADGLPASSFRTDDWPLTK